MHTLPNHSNDPTAIDSVCSSHSIAWSVIYRSISGHCATLHAQKVVGGVVSAFCVLADSFLGAFAKLWKATISFVMSVCLTAWNNSAPTGWIFLKSDFFFKNPFRRFLSLKYGKNNACFTEQVQKIKTYILWSIFFSRKSCRLWDNVEKYGTARQTTDDNIVRRTKVRFACRITEARIQIIIILNN